jgi:hypothetical protein
MAEAGLDSFVERISMNDLFKLSATEIMDLWKQHYIRTTGKCADGEISYCRGWYTLGRGTKMRKARVIDCIVRLADRPSVERGE